MQKVDILPLSHTVLYAKNWYKCTGDVFDDLKKILELDGYTPFTNGDVFSILVNNIERFDYREFELRQILTGIHPKECWKVCYYTNDHTWIKDFENLPKYDYETAVVYYILSTLKFLDTNKWTPVTPKYSKYPKNPELTTKQIIEQFNKKKS